MPEQFIAKKSSTNQIVDRVNAAGVAVVSGDLYVHDGTAARKVADAADNPIVGVASGYKIARGQATTVTASDTVVSGLATVVAVIAGFDDNPGDDPNYVSASIGDQAGSPAAGSFLLKTWKNTGGTDPTPAAASTFSKKINWIAIGT